MLPKGHKVGVNPVFNGRVPSTTSKVSGTIASGVKGASAAASKAGSGVAKAAAGAGAAAGTALNKVGTGISTAANRATLMAKHPVISAKGGVAAVKNSYTTTLNDPRRSGVGSTVASNVKNRPVTGAAKTAAAVTGALAPAAFVKGAVNPADAFRTRQALKQDKAEKKMGGLSWSPPTSGSSAAGGRPRPGAPA